jgi:hypothetical protein
MAIDSHGSVITAGKLAKVSQTPCAAFATALWCRYSDLCPSESLLSQAAGLMLGGALAKRMVTALAAWRESRIPWRVDCLVAWAASR